MEAEQTALMASLDAVVRKISPGKEQIRAVVEEVVAERVLNRVEFTCGDMVLGESDAAEHHRAEFVKICRAVYSGVNVALFGPAGSGKTHLCTQIAKALGLRFAFQPLTAGMSEGKLTGRFVPTGENGKFEYCRSEFADFYENGGLFLLDEMDAADPNVMLVINAALANGHMAVADPARPTIKRHPTFRCIAACNTFGTGADRQYVGRNQLDASTLDRFSAAKFEIGYDAEFEIKVGNKDLVRFVHALRRKIAEHGVRRIASTRLVIDGSKLMAAGFTAAEVMEQYFLDWSPSERNLVS